MKLTIILLFLFFNINSNGDNNINDTTQLTIKNSQDSLINNLQLTINNSKDDTTKIKLLRKIGAAYHNSQESLPYYQQALELCISIKNKKFEAECYNGFSFLKNIKK